MILFLGVLKVEVFSGAKRFDGGVVKTLFLLLALAIELIVGCCFVDDMLREAVVTVTFALFNIEADGTPFLFVDRFVDIFWSCKSFTFNDDTDEDEDDEVGLDDNGWCDLNGVV